MLTHFAPGRKRLPRGVDYPIRRDARHRRYRIEPVAAELLLSAIDRARAPRRMECGRCGVRSFDLTLAVVGSSKLAIPVAIRSLSQSRPGCDQSDGGPDAACADVPREHHADGLCLTSNP